MTNRITINRAFIFNDINYLNVSKTCLHLDKLGLNAVDAYNNGVRTLQESYRITLLKKARVYGWFIKYHRYFIAGYGNRFGNREYISLCKGRGVILSEPSVVAYHVKDGSSFSRGRRCKINAWTQSVALEPYAL